MEVPGKRRRGRPKRRWLDSIRNDLSERELPGEEAQDRVKWRCLIRKSTPHKSGKGCEEEDSSVVQTFGSVGRLKLTPPEGTLSLKAVVFCAV